MAREILGPTGAVSFAVRLKDGSSNIAAELQALVAQIDVRAAVEGMAPMDEIVAGTIARPRFYAFVVSAFGAIAGVLAAIGIYGVLAYTVVQRTKEIGIRLAVGGTPRDVRRLILRQGSVMVALGISGGIGVALGLARYLEGMLYGLTPVDPATYALVVVMFALTGFVACYVPARRATKIDPLMTLRAD